MVKKEKVKGFEKFKCSRCGSAFGYVQIKKNNWKCRKCNFEESLDAKLKEK